MLDLCKMHVVHHVLNYLQARLLDVRAFSDTSDDYTLHAMQRAIEPGEPLTLNYTPHMTDYVPEDPSSISLACGCGSDNCRRVRVCRVVAFCLWVLVCA